jgi:hypothetical protein
MTDYPGAGDPEEEEAAMTKRAGVQSTIWGILSILAGALMTQGGVMEVMAYVGQGRASNVAVGALGALTSVVMLVSGIAFCTGRAFGRKTAIAGAIGMIPVHFAGWMLTFVGISGVLVGVVYPAVLLVTMRVRPNLGAPVQTNSGSPPQHSSPPSNLAQRIARA